MSTRHIYLVVLSLVAIVSIYHSLSWTLSPYRLATSMKHLSTPLKLASHEPMPIFRQPPPPPQLSSEPPPSSQPIEQQRSPPPLPTHVGSGGSSSVLPPAPAALTLTFGTTSMRQYVHNWLVHASRVPKLEPFFAVALDRGLYDLCLEWRQPVLDALPLLAGDSNASAAIARLRNLRGYVRNERAGFKVFGFIKGRLSLRLLRQGYHILLADADSVFLANPWPWIGRMPLADEEGMGLASKSSHGMAEAYQLRSGLASNAGHLPSADVLVANDYPDLRRDGQPDSVFNTGLLFLRATRRAMRFVEEWAERTRQTAEIGNDQTELNRLLRGRYRDGEWGCNHDGCLEKDSLRFVPAGAVFEGEGCPNAPGGLLSRLRDTVARVGATSGVPAAGYDPLAGFPASDGPCPARCVWFAPAAWHDNYTGLARVDLAATFPSWQRCRDHNQRLGRHVYRQSRQAYWMWDGRVRLGILPMERFLQGHTYFVQRLHERRQVQPVHVHVTYAMGADFGKQWRLKTAGLWRDAPRAQEGSSGDEEDGRAATGRARPLGAPPPSPPLGSFVEVVGVEPLILELLKRMELPEEVWRCEPAPGTKGTPRPIHTFQTSEERDETLLIDRPSHFFDLAAAAGGPEHRDGRQESLPSRTSCYHPKHLVPAKPDMQTTNLTAAMDPAMPHMALQRLLRQLLRNAFALAFATGRRLVLPRMWALCERHWWQLVDCRTPGVASLPLPYEAPLDVAFDALRWAEIRDVGFVEHGHLSQGESASAARVHMHLREEAARKPAQESGALQDGNQSLEINAGATFGFAAQMLASQRGTAEKVVSVDAASLLRFSSCGFDDAITGEQFHSRVLRHVLAGQYSYCSEERNPFVEALLREAEARKVPSERLLITRRNCTGQPANDFNKPKVDLGADALAFLPTQSCRDAGSRALVDGAEDALRSALALVRSSAYAGPAPRPPPPAATIPPLRAPPSPKQRSPLVLDARLRAVNDARRARVVEAFRFSWDGYRKYAWGRDEVRPLTNGSNDAWGGFAVTMIDALDTALLMGLHLEVEEAIQYLSGEGGLTFDKSHRVSVFEMTIRVLGGLVGAYDLSKHLRQRGGGDGADGDSRLLRLAQHVGDRLLPGVIPTPSAELNVKTGVRGRQGNLAEQGSLQLEYARLSAITKPTTGCGRTVAVEGACKQRDYWGAARTFARLLDNAQEPESLNGGFDSFYEYVLKIFLLGNRTDPKLGAAYQTMAASIRTNLVKTCTDGSAFFAVRGGRQWQEHLACFAPGMLALGVLTGASGAPDEDTRVAIATGETCYRAYTNTPTGLAPDAWNFGAREQDYQPPVGIASERGPLPRCRGQVEATGSKFSLRPETIESLFYLYRLTRNETYRDYGWKIFEAIDRHCRTRIGYAGLTNVYRLGASTMEDSEPSFFMAEVLKYLYLLFSDEDVLPLDKWVLNTEAHPFLVEHHPTHGLDEVEDQD